MGLWYLPAVGWSLSYMKHTYKPTLYTDEHAEQTLVLYFHGSSVSVFACPPPCRPNPLTLSLLYGPLLESCPKTDQNCFPSLSLFTLLGSQASPPPPPFLALVSVWNPTLLCGWVLLQPLPIMVVPPARAAFDPWAKSSTVVVPRYGIWKWVWMSMPPGITIFPLASMVFTPPGTIRLSPICLSSSDDVVILVWWHDVAEIYIFFTWASYCLCYAMTMNWSWDSTTFKLRWYIVDIFSSKVFNFRLTPKQSQPRLKQHIVAMSTHQHSPLLFRLCRGDQTDRQTDRRAEASVPVSLPEAQWSSRHLCVYYATPGFLWVPLSELPH